MEYERECSHENSHHFLECTSLGIDSLNRYHTARQTLHLPDLVTLGKYLQHYSARHFAKQPQDRSLDTDQAPKQPVYAQHRSDHKARALVKFP